MGIFSGIKAAKVFSGGAYTQPGMYKTKVLKCRSDTTRKTEAFFAIDMEVLESSDLKAHPIGSEMTHMIMMKHDAALSNIKQFLNIAADIPLHEIDEQDCIDACSEENPLQGAVLRVSGVTIKTKALKDFTKVTYLPANTSAVGAELAHKEAVAAAAAAAAKSVQA